MPFIGIVAPTTRVQGLFGGASNASLGSAPLNNVVDATAQHIPGLVGWYKDPVFGRISVVAYAQAQASIPFGAGLTKVAGIATTLSSAGASTENGAGVSFVQQGSTGAAMTGFAYQFAGVAAASVINTGNFFWRYISGYVPFAKVGSVIASGSPLTTFPSTAGVLGKPNAAFNASNATSNSAQIAVGYVLTTSDAADGSMSSIWLSGWYA